MSAELNVELRLLLNQVGNDALKAADIVKKTLGMTLGQSGSNNDAFKEFKEGASKSKDIISQLNKEIKKLHTEMDSFRKQGIDLTPEFSDKMKKTNREMQSLIAERKAILGKSFGFGDFVWEKAVLRGQRDDKAKDKFKGLGKNSGFGDFFWEKAVLRGQGDDKPKDKFKGYGMSDLPKLFKPATPAIWNALRENAVGGIQGLRDITGKDLAKIKALPDITSFDKIAPKLNLGKVLLGLGVGASGNPFIGSRLLSDEFGKNAKQGGVAAGLFGKGGVVGFAEIYLGFKAFGFAIDHLKKSIEFLNKSLSNGLGVAFNTRRSMLAEVIGVSEEDVFRFGAAVAYLNPKLEETSKIMIQSNKSLTELSWGFSILEKQFNAVWSQIVDAMAPAINAFIDDLESMLDFLMKGGILKDLGNELKVVLLGVNLVISGIEIAVDSFVTGMKIIGDSIAYLIMTALNLLSKIPGLGSIGGFDTSKPLADIIAQSMALRAEIGKNASNIFGKDNKKMPPPFSGMKKLPSSAWEKMGLVIGGSGHSTNDLLKQIVKQTTITAAALSGPHWKNKQTAFGMQSVPNSP